MKKLTKFKKLLSRSKIELTSLDDNEKAYNIMDDPEEFAHFKNVCAALLHYKVI